MPLTGAKGPGRMGMGNGTGLRGKALSQKGRLREVVRRKGLKRRKGGAGLLRQGSPNLARPA